MSPTRKEIGNLGELLARDYLLSAGYAILAQNWRCPIGEVDLIAQHGDTIVFVEVRTRRGNRRGSPEESVTPTKQAKLIELAYTWLVENDGDDRDWRIDVVAIALNPRGEVARLNHIESAVQG